MSVRYTVVDAFTDTRFGGNPAAVVVLDAATKEDEISDEVKQKIAKEVNLSETAFLKLLPDHPATPTYELRWFTPTSEVELCGHATLASSYVLFEGPAKNLDTITFRTRYSGQLVAKKVDNGTAIQLDFPADATVLQDDAEIQGADRQAVVDAVGEACPEVKDSIKNVIRHRFGDLVEFDLRKSAKSLKDLKVNSFSLGRLSSGFSIWTCPSPDKTANFVSRVFAPNYGIPEDPVTGAAHCALAPYWLSAANKARLTGETPDESTALAKQVSERGGFMKLVWDREASRVRLIGKAVKTAEGTLFF